MRLPLKPVRRQVAYVLLLLRSAEQRLRGLTFTAIQWLANRVLFCSFPHATQTNSTVASSILLCGPSNSGPPYALRLVSVCLPFRSVVAGN